MGLKLNENRTKTVPKEIRQPLVNLLLSVADEKFFLGHRNSDWTGLGPFLEEDIAFCNIAQDEIAHAQELYKLAAAFTAPKKDPVVEANRLAYARLEAERLNATFVEVEDQFDWAVAVARQFFYDHYDRLRLPRLGLSSYKPLAELAGKMLLEINFHVEHFDGWIRKLAQGTAESKDRLQHAVDMLWPDALGLFEPLADLQQLTDAGIYPGDDESMQQAWLKSVTDVLTGAGLTVPPGTTYAGPGGRTGRHTSALTDLLADLAEVYQCEPNASW